VTQRVNFTANITIPSVCLSVTLCYSA